MLHPENPFDAPLTQLSLKQMMYCDQIVESKMKYYNVKKHVNAYLCKDIDKMIIFYL